MPQFAILMREDNGAWGRLSPEEQEALLRRYNAWSASLRQRGLYVSGLPLGSGGRVIKRVHGELKEGPFEGKQQVVTGYFVIEASDLEAAAEIARECPALVHGETVELRPVGH